MSEYCKYCGQKYTDARTLLSCSCSKHPDGRGKHALFEGDKEGPFDIAAVSEKYRYNGTLKTASDVVVCASTSLVDEIFLSNYYGSTQTSAEYMINLTKYLVASTEEIDADITSVDLSGNKLSFASGTDFILSFVSIVVILPVIFFAAGIVITLKRKHK